MGARIGFLPRAGQTLGLQHEFHQMIKSSLLFDQSLFGKATGNIHVIREVIFLNQKDMIKVANEACRG
jgi:hypothetical protein